MKVLLDENMPIDFGQFLAGHDVDHLETIGKKGTQNGELLDLARNQYDALVTLDRGILHQHRHFGDLIILVVRVKSSIREMVLARADAVKNQLDVATKGTRMEIPS